MSSYTCLSCSVKFISADLQRMHYKTEWHRYNLKRKVAELPPVTEEEFSIKAELQIKKKESKIQERSVSTYCKLCNKSFSSLNSFQNHVQSKKHQDLLNKNTSTGIEQHHTDFVKVNEKVVNKSSNVQVSLVDELDDDSEDWEDMSSDDEVDNNDIDETNCPESEAIPPTSCLFCNHQSTNIENNLQHMVKSHSFFIPDLEYVTNIEALLIYLGAKVGDGKVCLLCNTRSKQFQTIKACRDHMTDKGHCMINCESNAMLEFADFYDFSSTYPSSENVDVDMELSESDTSLSVDPETLELLLPSGARAGHRALKKYYNQSVVERLEQPKRSHAMILGLANHYRALDIQNGTLAVAVRRKLVAKKIENRNRLNFNMAVGVRANKLQTHFRKQVMYAG
uniref:Zinc finger protein 622 n=1 Tax=Hydra vulgaris TaxID=6087 RepID=T2M8J6_HYDVU